MAAVPESTLPAYGEVFASYADHGGRSVLQIISIDNLTPADVYFGRAQTIIKQRERIKRKTIEHRRLQHRKLAA